MKKYRLYRVGGVSGKCRDCGESAVEYFVLALNPAEVERCKKEKILFCRECFQRVVFELLRKGAYLVVE